MAGCEYLPNIERVGLKVALKHFSKDRGFKEVIAFLKSQKTYADRIPEDYVKRADQVALLFKMQTVYDPRNKILTQWSPISSAAEAKMRDLDYLGPHDPFKHSLVRFAKGEVVRAQMSERTIYPQQTLIDNSKIRMDFARNEIQDTTFVCLDYDFFKDAM